METGAEITVIIRTLGGKRAEAHGRSAMVGRSSCARGEQRAHTLAGQGPAYSRGRDPCARKAEGWGHTQNDQQALV